MCLSAWTRWKRFGNRLAERPQGYGIPEQVINFTSGKGEIVPLRSWNKTGEIRYQIAIKTVITSREVHVTKLFFDWLHRSFLEKELSEPSDDGKTATLSIKLYTYFTAKLARVERLNTYSYYLSSMRKETHSRLSTKRSNAFEKNKCVSSPRISCDALSSNAFKSTAIYMWFIRIKSEKRHHDFKIKVIEFKFLPLNAPISFPLYDRFSYFAGMRIFRDISSLWKKHHELKKWDSKNWTSDVYVVRDCWGWCGPLSNSRALQKALRIVLVAVVSLRGTQNF